jgi:mannose-1-phosphate guanylyltransferase/phosphomannomutase
MLKRAVISGLPSAGLNVMDLQSVPIPVARFYTPAIKAAGGVHVRISPFDPRVVDIRFFGADGMNLSKHEERNVERIFFREDFRRAYMDDIGTIEYANEAVPLYRKHFLASVDADAIRRAGFDIVVDYAYASTSQVLPEILQSLEVNTVPLGARVDPTYISLDPATFVEECRQLGAIVKALKRDLGVRLDVGGEKMYLADDRGELVPDALLCAAMTELVLRNRPGGTVAVPVNQSAVFERIARRLGGTILRTPVDLAPLMQAANGNGVAMAADGTGAFIFPEFQPVADAMMAVARLLEYLARRQLRLSELIAGLPPFHLAATTVECSWERKGSVMRHLHRHFQNAETQTIDGIKVFLNQDDEWVLIRPDPDRALFHVTAESPTPDRTRAVLEEYAGLVEHLRSK